MKVRVDGYKKITMKKIPEFIVSVYINYTGVTVYVSLDAIADIPIHFFFLC